MESIWQWGIAFIHFVQSGHGPVLDAGFTGFTTSGGAPFIVILILVTVWCVEFPTGMRLSIVFLSSAYVNIGLKDLFAQPRPFELVPSVKRYPAQGYGFPSGHAQSAVVVWGTIAASLRKKWAWIASGLLIALIGLSRVYLGVHFPTDVLGGWIVGAVLLWAYVAWAARGEDWLRESSLAVQLGVAAAAPLSLLVLHPTEDSVPVTAALMGMGIGAALTARTASFRTDGTLCQRALRLVVGVAGFLFLVAGVTAALPAPEDSLYFVEHFVIYSLLGLWVGFGAPWLFQRLRLAPGSSS